MKIFDTFIILLILLNTIVIVVETLPELKPYQAYFKEFEAFAYFVFLIEYFIRLIICTRDKRYSAPISGRIKYIFSPMALVDLVAILPLLLGFTKLDLRMFRIVRVFRLFQIFKLVRYNMHLGVIKNVIVRQKEQLLIALIFLFMVLLFSSTLMYYIEHDAQPEAFSSIPKTMWYSLVTLSTVGYGDIVPITWAGRLLSSLMLLFGIGIVALPMSILGAGFVHELRRNDVSKVKKESPHTLNDSEKQS